MHNVKGSFTRALNDAEVTVEYSYPSRHPSEAEISAVKFKGVDIWDAMNPEDQQHFLQLVPEKASEHATEERACAAEAKWRADREERLLAQA